MTTRARAVDESSTRALFYHGRAARSTMAAQHTVAVIGVGTVGQSWAALFLSYGNRVRLWDPAEGLAERFAAYLETVVTEEPLPPQPELGGLWVVCDTVEEALDGATFVQENAPENMDTKHAMLRQIRGAADGCHRRQQHVVIPPGRHGGQVHAGALPLRAQPPVQS